MDVNAINLSPALIALLRRAHEKQQRIFLNRALGTKGLVAGFLTTPSDELGTGSDFISTDFAGMRARFRENLRDRLTARELSQQEFQQTERLLQQWNQAIEFVSAGLPKLNNDQPWAGPPRDHLGISNDAIAIANVAAGQSTSLPLAFGIFGDWGAGKTFFMRLVHDQIARVIAFESKDDGFEHAIVQIQFNAWHYAETNLWASLVGHIFDALDRWMARDKDTASAADEILKRLATTRQLTLEAATELVQRHKAHAMAGEDLVKAREELEKKQEEATNAPRLAWQTALQVVRDAIKTDSELQQQIGSVQSVLGLSELESDKAKFEAALDEIKESASAGNAALGALRSTLGSGRTVALAIGALVGVPLILFGLHQAFSVVVDSSAFADATRGFEALGGLLATAAILVGSFARHAKSFAEKLVALRERIDQQIAQATASERVAVAEAERELTKLAAAVEEAKSVLRATGEQVATALRDYAAETGGMRLHRFVRSRAGEEGYAKHLGLVSMIRKDFEQLETLMLDKDKLTPQLDEERKHYQVQVEALIAQAGKELPNEMEQLRETAKSLHESRIHMPEKMQFRRIVLYIDDLDRCEPDKVVEVLQAVSMLLSFRLFVVLVAVDARWLSRSLETKYKDFFGAVGGGNGVEGNGAALATRTDVAGIGRATPEDYLEKIFQVPYWVPAMNDTSSVALVEDLVAPDRAIGSQNQHGAGGEQKNGNQPPSPSPPVSFLDPEDDQQQTLVPPEPALGLTSNEITALTALSPFLGGSPRRARRFVNVYRVAKASLAPAELKKIEAGEYRALATQLAIATGAPNMFGAWIAACEASDKSVDERLSDAAIEQRLGKLVGEDERRNLRNARKAYEGMEGSPTLQALADQAPRAARFSFAMPHKT